MFRNFILTTSYLAKGFLRAEYRALPAPPAAIVATERAVRANDAVAWNITVVIGAHNRADTARRLRIARLGRDLFVRHRLTLWDLCNDAFYFFSNAGIFFPTASRYRQ